MFRLFLKIALRSLFYYKGLNLVLLVACALSCAVIAGAFVSQTSLEYSLSKRVCEAFGGGEFLALSPRANLKADFFNSPLLILQKSAVAISGGKSRGVKICAVGENFAEYAQEKSEPLNLKSGEVAINRALAKSLDLKLGSSLRLAFFPLSSASLDFAFGEADARPRLRQFKVARILSASEFGNLSFSPTQAAPENVFFNLDDFCKLSGESGANFALLKSGEISLSALSLDDFNLSLNEGVLKSKSWFLPEFLEGEVFDKSLSRTLSWFVSDFKLKENFAHFGFALADESVELGKVKINSELAKELGAELGDKIELGFYVTDEFGSFKFKRESFEVSEIYPMQKALSLRPLMAHFEGLSDADSCVEWKSKLPIDFDLVKDSDKVYWSKYSYSPKVLLSLSDARRIFLDSKPASSSALVKDSADFFNSLKKLSPSDLGISLEKAKGMYLQNAVSGVDFSGIFFGLSFFIIVSALMLIGLAVSLSLNSRAGEVAELARIGFRKRDTICIYFFEFAGLALVGSLIGAFVGLAYGAIIAKALNGVWAGISAGADVEFNFAFSDLIFAFSISLTAALTSIYFSVRRLSKPGANLKFSLGLKSNLRLAFEIFSTCALAFLICLNACKALPLSVRATLSLFSFLLAGFALWNGFLLLKSHFSSIAGAAFLSFRRRSKALFSVFAMSALGLYLLMIVGLNNFSAKNLDLNSSGSGGYKYFIETSIPLSNLTLPSVGSNAILEAKVFESAQANCLNLNRVKNPRILGLDAGVLEARKAFTFDSCLPEFESASWKLLDSGLDGGEIPAFIDSASLLWSLKGKLGDVLEYSHGGKVLRFKIIATLAPSVFQGSLIISSKEFSKAFAEVGGSKVFLASDMPLRSLEGLFSAYYPAISTCRERLDLFNALQNSYLKIFLQLGILGMSLGFFACALLALGDAKSSSRELNFLNACGWRTGEISNFMALQYSLAVLLAALSAALGAIFVVDFSEKFVGIVSIVILSPGLVFLLSKLAFRFAFKFIGVRELN